MSHSWFVFCFNPSFLVGVVVWKAFCIQTRSLSNITPGKMMVERLCTFLVGVRLIFKGELFRFPNGAGETWIFLGHVSRRPAFQSALKTPNVEKVALDFKGPPGLEKKFRLDSGILFERSLGSFSQKQHIFLRLAWPSGHFFEDHHLLDA